MRAFIARILGIGKAVLDFYGPVLKSLFNSGASALLPVALQLVQSLANNGTTGAEKRERAVVLLTKVAQEQGIIATESLIRFTVESAYQRFLSEK